MTKDEVRFDLRMITDTPGVTLVLASTEGIVPAETITAMHEQWTAATVGIANPPKLVLLQGVSVTVIPSMVQS